MYSKRLNACNSQWLIQSWFQGGFPKVENLSGCWRTVPVKSVTPWLKNITVGGGGGGWVSGQPENPSGYATDSRLHLLEQIPRRT